MLRIIYSPNSALSVPDGSIIERAIFIYNGYKSCFRPSRPILEHVTSSFILIDAFRVLIKEGKIKCDEIEFVFRGEIIKADKDGRILNWPEGFGDTYTYLLLRLT